MNFIVTGASRGIGRAIVREIGSRGRHQVLAVARSKDKLEELREEVSLLNKDAVVFPLPLDVSDGDAVRQLVEFSGNIFSGVDVLINNAGLLIHKDFKHLNADDFDKIFNVNVKSVFLLVQALLPYFNKNSHIVNISSMGGVQGSLKFPGLSLYSASKGALNILTESLAEEFKASKISVNGLALGAVQTEMLEQAFPDYKAPLSAEDMAGYIVGFAMEGHQFFNGKILPVALSTP